MKRLISILIAAAVVSLLLDITPVLCDSTAWTTAAENVSSDETEYHTDFSWEINEDGLLTVDSPLEGAMLSFDLVDIPVSIYAYIWDSETNQAIATSGSYKDFSNAPWFACRIESRYDYISGMSCDVPVAMYTLTDAVVGKNIAYISDYSFYNPGLSGSYSPTPAHEPLNSITIENPYCIIKDSDSVINAQTIYGYDGSTAQTFAEEHSIEFISFGAIPFEEEITLPDGTTITVKKEQGVYTIISCDPSAASVDIPEEIHGVPVTEIADGAFQNCEMLKSIKLPASITAIGKEAFSGCTALTSISIPENVEKLKSGLFQGCTSLTAITLPDMLTGMEENVFSGCTSLKSVTIPEGVKSIKSLAFSGCSSLESITLPDKITMIEGKAFSGCTSLKSIVIPDSITFIGVSTFRNCISLESVTLPESVKKICNEAFYGCTSLTSITIPGSVNAIEYRAFYGCSGLASIALPEEMDSIGYEVFYGCKSLTSIVIPNGLYTLSSGMLEECTSLTSVTLPDSLINISTRAFYNCGSLKSITIPDSVTVIDSYAFWGCGIESIHIPDGVTKIADHCFINSSLTTVTIPYSVTLIDDDSFYCCPQLREIVILNPECKISSGKSTICNDYEYKEYTDGNLATMIESYSFGTTIIAPENSEAYSYFKSTQAGINDHGDNSFEILGDVNNDRTFSISDLIVMQKYLMNDGFLEKQGVANLTNDACIDAFDLMMMKRLLLSASR